MRNGGQIVNGLNASLQSVKKRYGQGTAMFVAGLAKAHMKELNPVSRDRQRIGVQAFRRRDDFLKAQGVGRYDRRALCPVLKKPGFDGTITQQSKLHHRPLYPSLKSFAQAQNCYQDR